MHGDPPCIVVGGLVVLEVQCPDTILALRPRCRGDVEMMGVEMKAELFGCVAIRGETNKLPYLGTFCRAPSPLDHDNAAPLGPPLDYAKSLQDFARVEPLQSRFKLLEPR